MDFWILFQERAIFIILLAVFILFNVLMVFAIWKRRDRISKRLLYMVTMVSTLLILVSSVLTIFVWTFGYNA